MPYEGLARYATNDGVALWTGKVVMVEKHLFDPLRWKKPRRIFVNSMSDLFHESLPFEAIDRIIAVMALAQRHTFQILTKRAERMKEYLSGLYEGRMYQVADTVKDLIGYYQGPEANMVSVMQPIAAGLSHCWFGVSVEDQKTADARIPWLLKTPAAVRWVSYEPALGPVQFSRAEKIDWIVVGGESGPGAREFDVAWARSVIEQCKAAGVACFVKQLGAKPVDNAGRMYLQDPKGGNWYEWPDRLRMREYPIRGR